MKSKSTFIKLSRYSFCLILIFCISCKKSIVESNNSGQENAGDAGVQLNSVHPTTKVTYPFYSQCSGSFTISLVSATIAKIHQDLLFSSTTPFPLVNGMVEGYDDLTILTFPERFFNGTLNFIGQGNDAMFGTVTVQTSVFTDPVDPYTGDFYGSEDFTGTFQITGGTGRYLNATGSGTYTAHSDYVPPTVNGILFSGLTTLTATGTVSVVPKNGKLTE
jgi:hypothetical protein